MSLFLPSVKTTTAVTATVTYFDVYGHMGDLDRVDAYQVARSSGYCPVESIDFRLPLKGEYYVNPQGIICQKLPGDRGPHGPRLIVKPLNSLQRTYGVDFDTAEKVFAATISTPQHDPKDYEILGTAEKFFQDQLYIYPTWHSFIIIPVSDIDHYGKTFVVVRKKEPRKKFVLVFDYDEVRRATGVLVEDPRVGLSQEIVVLDYNKPFGIYIPKTRSLKGRVEEREV